VRVSEWVLTVGDAADFFVCDCHIHHKHEGAALVELALDQLRPELGRCGEEEERGRVRDRGGGGGGGGGEADRQIRDRQTGRPAGMRNSESTNSYAPRF